MCVLFFPFSEDTSLPVQPSKEFRIATAVFPVLSLLNHSCQPNTSISFNLGLSSSGSNSPAYFTSGVTVTVRACRDIAAGQELLHCYGKGFLKTFFKNHIYVHIIVLRSLSWKKGVGQNVIRRHLVS